MRKFLMGFYAYRHLDALVQTQATALETLATENSGLELRLLEADRNMELERTKRIAAEAIAAERGLEIERVREELKWAAAARDTAVSERLKSLDLVNAGLLKTMAPEAAPDISKWKQLVPEAPKVPSWRAKDMEFIDGLFAAHKKAKTPPEESKIQ